MKYFAALPITVLLFVACGTEKPVQPPPPPKLEGEFLVSERGVQKCFPVTFNTKLVYNDTDPKTVRFEYNFKDSSDVVKTTRTEATHIFVTSGSYFVNVKAFVGNNTVASYDSNASVDVSQTDRECTYIVGRKDSAARKAGATASGKALGLSLQEQTTQAVTGVDGKIVYTYEKVFDGVAAQLTPEAVTKLEKDPALFVDSNVFFKTSSEDRNWGLDRMVRKDRNDSVVFDPSNYSGGKGVDVYVVDSGVRASHLEFDNRVKQGFNALSPNLADTSDNNTNSHGTHVAGIVAGKTTGVARRANIIPIKVFDGGDTVDAATLYRALDEIAKRHTPDKTAIVNLSLSTINTPVGEKLESDLRLQKLVDLGLLLVVAAGNNSSLQSQYSACQFSPAKLGKQKGVIVVGATDSNDYLYEQTNTGDCVDVFAPGVNIRSAARTGDTSYIEQSGTSMAAPHVAGLAALYLEQNPSAPPAQVEDKILQYVTAGKINFAGRQQFGAQNRLAFIAPELNKAGVQVSLKPSEITLEAGTTQDFVAAVKNSSDTRVKWQFGNGTPSSEGQSTFRLTAPSVTGDYTLRAISMADEDVFAQAKITVVAQRDTIKPTVTEFSTPNTTITTSGPVVLNAKASDNIGVTHVEFWQGDTKLGDDYDTDNDQTYTRTLQLTDNDTGTKKIQAYAVDASSNRSEPKEIVLTIAIPDTTKPNVVLTGNTTRITQETQLTLNATASDNRGITKLEFYDGDTKLGEINTQPYEFKTTLLLANNGPHIYTAKAYDAAGNVGISGVWNVDVVILDVIPPTVAFTTQNSTITSPGSFVVKATATDNLRVTKVEFWNGTTKLGTDEDSDNDKTYTHTFVFTDNDIGTRGIQAISHDAAGNRSTPSEITLTFNIPDTTKPTVSLESSARQFYQPGQLVLSVAANDNRGISRVEYYDLDTKIGESYIFPYEFKTSVGLVNNGTHVYTAKAYDAAGNLGVSNAVNVQVSIGDLIAPNVALVTSKNDYRDEGEIVLTAVATDNPGGGILRVDFYRDGNLLGSDETAPYEFRSEILESMNGTRSFKAVAVDKSQNSASVTSYVNVQIWKGIKTFPSSGKNKNFVGAIIDTSDKIWVLACSQDPITPNADCRFMTIDTKVGNVDSQPTFYGRRVLDKAVAIGHSRGTLSFLEVVRSLKSIRVYIRGGMLTDYDYNPIDDAEDLVDYQYFLDKHVFLLKNRITLAKKLIIRDSANVPYCDSNTFADAEAVSMQNNPDRITLLSKIKTGTMYQVVVKTLDDRCNVFSTRVIASFPTDIQIMDFKKQGFCGFIPNDGIYVDDERTIKVIRGNSSLTNWDGSILSCKLALSKYRAVTSFDGFFAADTYNSTIGQDLVFTDPLKLLGQQTLIESLEDSKGNTYVVGSTDTSIPGSSPVLSAPDLFIAKYGADGKLR